MITQEQYDNHDCHLSRESGCQTCEEWFEQEFDKRYAQGEFDDQMILDDNLPDVKDNYVVEKINEKQDGGK